VAAGTLLVNVTVPAAGAGAGSVTTTLIGPVPPVISGGLTLTLGLTIVAESRSGRGGATCATANEAMSHPVLAMSTAFRQMKEGFGFSNIVSFPL
jgi:putative Mn2+ efflux pump MntP